MQKYLWIGGSLALLGIMIYLNNRTVKTPRTRPITLDELANKYSNKCDELIISELNAKNGELDYVSGIFEISLQENHESVKVHAKLYFQKKDGKWMEKTSEDVWNIKKLTPEAIEELKKNAVIKYEVNQPALSELA
jgi:hypothetical protein